MIAFAPAILFAALQTAAVPAPFRDEADLFVRVCTQGGGRFDPGSIRQIAAIPAAAVRNALPPQRQNRFYTVRLGEGEAFLILQDTIGEDDPTNIRHCSVATSGMNFGQAVRRVFPGRDEPTGWRYLPDASFHQTSGLGHSITIQRLGRRYVLMTAIVPAPEAARHEEVLQAFRDGCERSQGSYHVVAKHALFGLQPIAPASDPRLERAASLASAEDGTSGPVTAYRTSGRGRPVFLLFTADPGSGSPRGSCRLYDFDAEAPIDPRATQRWVRSKPVRDEEAAGATEQLWQPGWDADTSLHVRHIPRNSALARQFGFSGNVLVVRAVGDP